MTILLLVACSSSDFSGLLPTVKFERLELQTIDFTEIGVEFVFDVYNPNPVDVPLSRFDYALGFEGIEVLSGDNPEGLMLVAEDSADLALPVTLDFEGIFAAAEAIRGQDTIGFNLDGGFGFDTDLGPVDIIYAEDGEFPALRTPVFNLGQLRLGAVDFEQVDFEIDIDVDNDHGSNMLFSNLDFDLSFAGARVGGGLVEELGEVPGASTETFRIPFSLDYVDAIDALDAAISGDELRVDLGADVDVDTPFGPVPLRIDEQGDVSVREE